MIGFTWHPCDPDSPNDEDSITIDYRDRLPQTIRGEHAATLLKSILQGAIHQPFAATFPRAAKGENREAA